MNLDRPVAVIHDELVSPDDLVGRSSATERCKHRSGHVTKASVGFKCAQDEPYFFLELLCTPACERIAHLRLDVSHAHETQRRIKSSSHLGPTLSARFQNTLSNNA